MPKRSNDFQKLVFLIRKHVAAGAVVTESKMLVDRITKRKREVDVCVEGVFGGEPIVISVECIDHARIADVTWVDKMKAKHERLPTNRLVLVSRRGFTPEARTVAAKFGIQIVALDEDPSGVQKLFGVDSPLFVKSATLATEVVQITLASPGGGTPEVFNVVPTNMLVTADGTEFPVAHLINAIVRMRTIGDQLLDKGEENSTWFELDWEPLPDKPLFMKKISDPEVLRKITHIYLRGECKVKTSTFDMRPARLGEIDLAWGKTEICGQDALVVATPEGATTQKFSVEILTHGNNSKQIKRSASY